MVFRISKATWGNFTHTYKDHDYHEVYEFDAIKSQISSRDALGFRWRGVVAPTMLFISALSLSITIIGSECHHLIDVVVSVNAITYWFLLLYGIYGKT